MHFMIQTFKIIIIAILFSNIITKQNENATSRNNKTHTTKESDDDEYVDIKNKGLDNNIKNNESNEFKIVKNVNMLTGLVACLISLCVCTLVIVIINCRRENISYLQCIRRNGLIVCDCCRRGFRDDINTNDQPSYHAEHSSEDFCRWCLAFDYFNFRRSNPQTRSNHQPDSATSTRRAQCVTCTRRAEVAEPSVIFDGTNVSIQEQTFFIQPDF